MSNKFKDIDIYIDKPHILLFNDIINIKNFDPNKIKTDEKPYKKYMYLLHWICDNRRYEILKNRSYLIIQKVNGYFEEINKNEYLMLVPAN